MGERRVRNAKVAGSNPAISTIRSSTIHQHYYESVRISERGHPGSARLRRFFLFMSELGRAWGTRAPAAEAGRHPIRHPGSARLRRFFLLLSELGRAWGTRAPAAEAGRHPIRHPGSARLRRFFLLLSELGRAWGTRARQPRRAVIPFDTQAVRACGGSSFL